MHIPVVSAVGRGETLLSSFDAALHGCSVHNYNLLSLSSVIPPGASVAPSDGYADVADRHGHSLYVVKAESRSNEAGLGLAAGIGWYQWGDGRGVFVEHETTAPTAAVGGAEVRDLVCRSLSDLRCIRDVAFEERRVGMDVATATVKDRPTTVLVVAVYLAEGWG